MSKLLYTKVFQVRAVRTYLKSGMSSQAFAKQHGLNNATLRCWVRRYQRHQAAAFNTPLSQTTRYEPAFKLHVLYTMWEQQLNYAQTAAQFNIGNQTTVKRWQHSYLQGELDAFLAQGLSMTRKKPLKLGKKPVPTTLDAALEEIAALRAEVDYLKKSDVLVPSNEKAPVSKRSSSTS